MRFPPTPPPIDFLCAIYRDPRQPMHRRLKAAVEGAPFCHPQLKATAVILGSDFETKLENAVKRIGVRPIDHVAEPEVG